MPTDGKTTLRPGDARIIIVEATQETEMFLMALLTGQNNDETARDYGEVLNAYSAKRQLRISMAAPAPMTLVKP
jgi:hypothetical protein